MLQDASGNFHHDEGEHMQDSDQGRFSEQHAIGKVRPLSLLNTRMLHSV